MLSFRNFVPTFALVLLTAASAAQAEPKNTYRKYLGAECAHSRHFDSTAGLLQPVGGAAEIGAVVITAMNTSGPIGKVASQLSLLTLADGAGRIIGGKCAGMTGVDDLVLAPTLKSWDGAVYSYKNLFEGDSPAPDSKGPNRSPAVVEAGAAAFGGR